MKMLVNEKTYFWRDSHSVVLHMLQYLGFCELSLQELQGLGVSLLTVLQGGQLLLHLPLQHQEQQVRNW